VQETKATQRKAEFDAKIKVFNEKQVKEATTKKDGMKAAEINLDLYKKIAELRDEAIKISSQDVERAFEKLEDARIKAQQFLNNPLSIQANARNNLVKVGERWLKTISTFVKSMNLLKAAVKASMEAENARLTTIGEAEKFNSDSFIAMEKLLTEAARSFDATKFRVYIEEIETLLANLAKTPTDETARKKYRELKEDALRFVRAYQTVVTKDPILLKAASNPFKVEVSLSSVKEALRDLELNLRRA